MSATKLSPLMPPVARLIGVTGVAVVRGGRLLFQNVNFEVTRGAVVQLAGANGTGKTSLLRVMAGALPPAAGTVEKTDNLRIACLPADDLMWQGTQGVRVALNDWARAIDAPVENVERALAACGMAALATRPVAQLSMGQKRRLSWARLLLKPSDLWLLDEPFNSLDDAGLASVRDLMARHVAAGGGIVAACHEQLPKQFAARDVTVFDVNAVVA